MPGSKTTSCRASVMQDPNSVANFTAFATKHIKLAWNVSFKTSKISGTATLTLARLQARERIIKLDCSHLLVKKVADKGSGESLKFKVNPKVSKFGGLLEVELASTSTDQPTYEIE